MNEDMSDSELLVWMELRFGITKTVGPNPTNDRISAVESELMDILTRCRETKKLQSPVPRVRMWVHHDKLHFMFFDRKTGKRILLGNWIDGRDEYYEH